MEKTTVAVSIESIEEIKDLMRSIIDPEVFYRDDVEEMKNDVISSSRTNARKAFQMLNGWTG